MHNKQSGIAFPNTIQLVIATKENLISTDYRAGKSSVTKYILADKLELGSGFQDIGFARLIRDKKEVARKSGGGTKIASKTLLPK